MSGDHFRNALKSGVRFAEETDGGAAIVHAALAPVLIFGLALGAEASAWEQTKRRLQNAADVAAYAAAAEGALHLEDILARRMRVSIEYPHRGVDCAREVAEVVAPILGWTQDRIDTEVDTYVARVEAEVRSQTQPDDESADALRVAAPEARAEILEPVPLD